MISYKKFLCITCDEGGSYEEKSDRATTYATIVAMVVPNTMARPWHVLESAT